jgi:hypothetical protein
VNWKDKKDLLWITLVAALILILSSIPTWAGELAQTNELHFRGIYFDPQDYSVDSSMMQAGRLGEWAYEFRFTTETPHPAYVRLFYITLGRVGKWIHLRVDQTYELARWIFGFTALLALYDLFRRIFQETFWARAGFLLAVLGAGLGWLQLFLHWSPGTITPIDFWFIDGYVLFSLSLFPHFTFALTGMCIAVSLWLEYLKTRRWLHVFWITIIAVLVQATNPIAFAVVDVGMLGATLFAWWQERRAQWRDVGALSLLALAQLPLLIYNFIVLTRDPLWSQYTLENQTLSPSFIYYLLGFALFWPLVIAGGIVATRKRIPAAGMALFWIVSAFLLAYAPVGIQRRFLLGITIPMGILSVWILKELSDPAVAKNPGLVRWRNDAVVLFIFLASISSLYLSLGRAAYLQSHPAEFFYPASVDNAVEWLNGRASANDFVLASEQSAQIVAQKTDLRVYFGHEMETLNFEAKQKDVISFYENKQPVDWIKTTPIKWVIYGPLEEGISSDFTPLSDLQLVYDEQGVKIFEVK